MSRNPSFTYNADQIDDMFAKFSGATGTSGLGGMAYLSAPLTVSNGGTGATSPLGARRNLEIFGTFLHDGPLNSPRYFAGHSEVASSQISVWGTSSRNTHYAILEGNAPGASGCALVLRAGNNLAYRLTIDSNNHLRVQKSLNPTTANPTWNNALFTTANGGSWS